MPKKHHSGGKLRCTPTTRRLRRKRKYLLFKPKYLYLYQNGYLSSHYRIYVHTLRAYCEDSFSLKMRLISQTAAEHSGFNFQQLSLQNKRAFSRFYSSLYYTFIV